MKTTSKTLIIGILVSFILISLMPTVLAQTTEEVLEGIADVFKPISSAILGGVDTGEALFSKFLLFILVAMVIYTIVIVIPGFEGKTGIATVISIIVSILGVRFLITDNLINAILLPYGALFISLSVGIPLVIFFFAFSKITNPIVRKAGWALYVAAFGILGWMRASDLGKASLIYVIAIILAFIALLFDGTIQKLKRAGKIEKAKTSTKGVEIKRALARLADLNQGLGRATSAREIADYKKQITAQNRAIKALSE